MPAESILKRAWENDLSRRDFLRTTGQLGMAALALPPAVHSVAFGAETPRSGASGYEYAAGDVVLPFSYSATRSPAPKPENLDFSHQVSPDNCQVFIRIDDELWEFRSQWVINLGTTARYKGPDVDRMTRVEDGAYPDGMTSCWFLGGMWYDESEKKLYAPMHIEHDGIRRSYPFSRKIALATSTDKEEHGATKATSSPRRLTTTPTIFSSSPAQAMALVWRILDSMSIGVVDTSTSSPMRAGRPEPPRACVGIPAPPAAPSATKWRPANGGISTMENGTSLR
jgi:hypothetical protein